MRQLWKLTAQSLSFLCGAGDQVPLLHDGVDSGFEALGKDFSLICFCSLYKYAGPYKTYQLFLRI